MQHPSRLLRHTASLLRGTTAVGRAWVLAELLRRGGWWLVHSIAVLSEGISGTKHTHRHACAKLAEVVDAVCLAIFALVLTHIALNYTSGDPMGVHLTQE